MKARSGDASISQEMPKMSNKQLVAGGEAKQTIPRRAQKMPTLLALGPQTSSLWNWETIHFCCLNQ